MIDLYTPIAEASNLHHNFKSILLENDKYTRGVLSGWADGFIDRDGKFVKEFQTSFNSSFWELYIFACLKEYGYKVDFTYSRPDFVVSSEKTSFCIEASIASNAQDSAEEWERDLRSENLKSLKKDEIVDVATIRLANTLITKYKKYNKEYSKLSHVRGKPFVLAIAPFEQPFFYMQNDQAMQRVLYGFDKFIYKDIPEKNKRIILDKQYMNFIEKPNGAEIPLGFFVNEEMNEISAILFSNTATFGKLRALSDDPGDIFFEVIRYNDKGLKGNHSIIHKKDYTESLLDGLSIFHNPNATLPLSLETFDRPGVCNHNYDLYDNMPIIKTYDGFLFQRTAIKTQSFDKEMKESICKVMDNANCELQQKVINSTLPLSFEDISS